MKLKHPLVKLPPNAELILLLLKEDLKSRKFFNSLRVVGLDDSYYQSDFSPVILADAGLDDEQNETYDFYYNLMEKHSELMESNNDSAINHAFEIYLELIMEKKRRSLLKV
jgi:hypothetical protein